MRTLRTLRTLLLLLFLTTATGFFFQTHLSRCVCRGYTHTKQFFFFFYESPPLEILVQPLPSFKSANNRSASVPTYAAVRDGPGTIIISLLETRVWPKITPAWFNMPSDRCFYLRWVSLRASVITYRVVMQPDSGIKASFSFPCFGFLLSDKQPRLSSSTWQPAVCLAMKRNVVLFMWFLDVSLCRALFRPYFLVWWHHGWRLCSWVLVEKTKTFEG